METLGYYLRDIGPLFAAGLVALFLLRMVGIARRRKNAELPKVPVPIKVVGALAAAGVVLLAFLWTFLWSSNYYPGRARSVAFLSGARGEPLLVALESVEHVGGRGSWRDYRLGVVDLTRGERRARVLLSGDVALLGTAPGGVWLYSSGRGLHLREPATGAQVVGQEEIERRNPSLAGRLLRPRVGARKSAYRYDAERAAISVFTDQGRWFDLDAQTLVATPRAAAPRAASCRGSARARVALTGSPRATLRVAGKVARPDESFLSGRLVFDPRGCAPLELEGPSVLVVHRETLRADSARLLSRVSLGGGVRWSYALGADDASEELLGVRLIPGALLVVRPRRAVALDPDSGQERWRYDF
jgi:hypothetical protein